MRKFAITVERQGTIWQRKTVEIEADGYGVETHAAAVKAAAEAGAWEESAVYFEDEGTIISAKEILP